MIDSINALARSASTLARSRFFPTLPTLHGPEQLKTRETPGTNLRITEQDHRGAVTVDRGHDPDIAYSCLVYPSESLDKA